ncbi:MAG: DUF4388 domain-containing protein [Acidobacteriota bacterium]|nr:DUF4388 domain-containing protein [Acidobacteriota bacterium]MDQ7086846.1 DUF4388 domain-containing protein [Acidobacteriota bacterium]
MALKGTLGDFSLTDILQLIGLQRKTGVLVLRRGGDEISIAFDNGRVVAADSSLRPLEHRVGQLLVRTGKLTEARLDEALAIQRETLQRLGHVLASQGWVDKDSLRHQLSLQITETIYDLFRWQDGEYDFQPNRRVEWDREFITPIACETLLMEGAQMVDEWPLIERTIPSRLAVLRPTRAAQEVLATVGSESSEVRGSVYEDDIDFGFIPADPLEEEARTGAPQLTRSEVKILRWVDGRRSATEIAELSEVGTFEAFKTLARLVEGRLVEIADQDTEERKTPSGRLFRSAGPARLMVGLLSLLVVLGGAMAVQETMRALAPGAVGRWLPAPLASAAWLSESTGLEHLRRAVAAARLARIEQAIRAYYLAEGAWPRDLASVEALGLLSEPVLFDPWGRPIRYELEGWGYRLSIGEGDASLLREHRFAPLERSFTGSDS